MMKRIILLSLCFIVLGYGYIQAQTERRALLLIDIQNDYFDDGVNPLFGASEASLNAKKVLNTFRKDSLLVVHVQHLSTRSGSAFFIPNTKGAEIHENVAPLVHEKIITKNYPNSFRETELLEFLRSRGITELVVCGMMTHMCVDATVRAAKDYGFDCTIISNACATKDLNINGKSVSADNVQTAFLAALEYYYATIHNTDEYIEQFKVTYFN